MEIGTPNKPQRQHLKFIIPPLIIVAIFLAVLAPIFALSWAQQPFVGTFFYPRLIVPEVFHPQSYNTFQSGEVLVSIDGEPVSSGRELFVYLSQKNFGDTASLTILTPAGETREEVVLLHSFSMANIFTFFWLPYGIGIIYIALGFIVYRFRSDMRSSQVFILFCLFGSMLLTALFDQYTLHLLAPVWALAFPLTGAALIHLALVLPRESRLIRLRPWLGHGPYMAALLLGFFTLYGSYFSSDPALQIMARTWNYLFIGLSVLFFLLYQFYIRFSTVSSMVRQQALLIFWGSVLAFGPATLWAVSQAAGLADSSSSSSSSFFVGIIAPLLFFPVVITYAALRYQLLDLDVIVSRGITYTLLTVSITFVYFLAVTLLALILQNAEVFGHPIILSVFVLVLVVFLEPVRQRIQSIINNVFQRESFDSRELLQSYGRSLISAPLDINRILQMLLRQTSEAFQPESSLVFLRDPEQDIFEIAEQYKAPLIEGVAIQFAADDELVQWLATTNDILYLGPTGEVSADIEINPEQLARLNILNVVLCVPLLGSQYLLGWLALGLKQSGQPYTSSDFLFLTTLASQTTIALQNALLLDEANQRTAELEALQKISADIQAAVEPNQLLTFVLLQATLILETQGGMVYLLEPDDETLRVAVSYNLHEDYTGYTLKADEGLAGRVFREGRTVVLNNYQGLSSLSPQFEEAEFGAMLGVPLQLGEKIQGVFHLIHRPSEARFNRQDVRVMELFATQTAIALEKSQLLQEAQHRANQLATLSEVSTAISATLDLDMALQQVMERAVDFLNAEAGSLFLMHPETNELSFDVVLGPTGKELIGMRIPVGKGIVGTVAATSQPLIINDVAGDPRWNVEFDEATQFQTNNILCVPMMSRDRVVGVIEIINKLDGSIFTEEERDLLFSFGAQAAIAIENAQRFTRTDQALAERVQELQTLQMFDQELQTSLELQKVLDISLTSLMDALGLSMGLMGIVARKDQEEGIYLLVQRGMPMEMSRYKRDPWPLTKGVIGRVTRTGQGTLVNDISQDKDYVPKNHRTRSLLIAPVLREGQVIAVLDMESTEPHYFTEDDLSFVRLLLSHAAIAIENAQLFEKVREANQAKTEFMNTASHELKIPMTSIKGYAKLLQMGAGGQLTDQQAEFLNIISGNIDRMKQLVEDLLDVSRIEAGRIRLQIQDVQIEDVIEEVVESVRTQIETKKQSLELQIAEDLPQLRADYNRLIQIVTNLLSNAYKYTPEGGHITVIAQPANGDIKGVSVTVKDTGYGISEEDQANLFTTFFRASDQNIRNEPGTGLGLAITKKMVESHGGELLLDSELGKGSAFTFTMPLVSKIPPGVEVVEK